MFERPIKDGQHALKWTRLRGMPLAANAVRLRLNAPINTLAGFLPIRGRFRHPDARRLRPNRD